MKKTMLEWKNKYWGKKCKNQCVFVYWWWWSCIREAMLRSLRNWCMTRLPDDAPRWVDIPLSDMQLLSPLAVVFEESIRVSPLALGYSKQVRRTSSSYCRRTIRQTSVHFLMYLGWFIIFVNKYSAATGSTQTLILCTTRPYELGTTIWLKLSLLLSLFMIVWMRLRLGK